MNESKERLIEIADELFERGIIGTGMLRGTSYDVCNGHIEFNVKSRNPNTWSKLWKSFESLGYIVKSGGYNYMDVYWEEETSDIDDVFAKYK